VAAASAGPVHGCQLTVMAGFQIIQFHESWKNELVHFCVSRCTMKQLGLSLSEDDVHAMMRSVGVGPHGKISYPGISCTWITLN